MLGSRMGMFAALAAGLLASSGAGAAVGQLGGAKASLPVRRFGEVPRVVFDRPLGFSGIGGQRRRGPGWTNRHAQRVALKKRNRAKHRAACRG